MGTNEHKNMENKMKTQKEQYNNSTKIGFGDGSGARVLTTLSTYNYELEQAREQGRTQAISEFKDKEQKIFALRERIDKKEKEIGELSDRGLSYSLQMKHRRILLAKLKTAQEMTG